MEAAEFGGFFFATADQAAFLKLQVAKLLFVDEMRVQLNETAPDVRILLILELSGKFDTASGVDSHFERGDAA